MTGNKLRKRLAAVVSAGALAVGMASVASPAEAGYSKKGTRSLAAVLAADGSGFDRNRRDFDILDNVIGAVLANKKNSPVAILADGNATLTAFLPSDKAFKRLANDALGKAPRSEKQTFTALAGALPIDTLEAVLLYHVVPGAHITYREALKADGVSLPTALEGESIEVDVRRFLWFRYIALIDNNDDARNPLVFRPNINKGNKQIAHGINRVLMP